MVQPLDAQGEPIDTRFDAKENSPALGAANVIDRNRNRLYTGHFILGSHLSPIKTDPTPICLFLYRFQVV